MTPKERFIKALKREPLTGLVPHFELVFYLTMEVLGKVHPSHRSMHQWNQMTVREQELQLQDIASCHIDIAKKYGHSAIFVHSNAGGGDEQKRLLEIFRERTGDDYFLMLHGDCTYGMPNGDNMVEFTAQMYEKPDELKERAARGVDWALNFAAKYERSGLLDGFALCSDYCFNTNPFFTPDLFAELVAPYLKEVIAGYRRMGYYSIKHTDGNIMPILDQMADCEPDAFHSLDPQGGVDLKEVKRLYGNKICMIGNVNCGLLQTGSEDEVERDVLRCLGDGMPGYGFIFSTSNCVYTGLPLERYELMHRLWQKHGVYS
ncbi:MAG: uroporphyrinogen decarboxylase family protein [Defluviitaleaceae bacterium]|nr:uroporphyrinogen decarboxylase family protein [Defluviitaleaceae bacterium]